MMAAAVAAPAHAAVPACRITTASQPTVRKERLNERQVWRQTGQAWSTHCGVHALV